MTEGWRRSHGALCRKAAFINTPDLHRCRIDDKPGVGTPTATRRRSATASWRAWV
jgi:hypothetical protein